jgi:RimJ/RimL family protein N-acetyltransferase
VRDWSAEAVLRRVWAREASCVEGVIGLGELKVRSLPHQRAEIAYAIHVDHWGHGLRRRRRQTAP